MPDTTTLGVFLIASLALLVIPGPTVMYIVARGVQKGRTAALIAMLGVEVGTLIQLIVATLGISAIVASSPLAFSALKYVGAGYLAWLALRTALAFDRPLVAEPPGSPSLRPVFLQGMLVEAVNPKTALFFLAFLPQFTDATRGPVAWQLLAFGLVFILLATFSDGLVGLLAGTLGGWLRGRETSMAIQRHLTGFVYTSLALNVALIGSGAH